ncbi:PD-(D/E)XK nuclease family protein, partial [Vibrio neonatus]
MNKPNIFEFATSELSQDAFICWLLSWSSPKYSTLDENLHSCSKELLTYFLSLCSVTVPKKISKVRVHRQYNNIDILCIVNDELAIIIEDKTGTVEHSNQLKRYYNIIQKKGFDKDKIAPIYLQTYQQASYANVVNSGYNVCKREQLLSILNNHSYKIDNNIFCDFYSHLKSLNEKFDTFRSYPISKWTGYSWQGFYSELQNSCNDSYWERIDNPSGGYWGFWWHHTPKSDCKMYIQIEQEKLCIKIEVLDRSLQSELRTKWHNIALEYSRQHNLNFER